MMTLKLSRVGSRALLGQVGSQSMHVVLQGGGAIEPGLYHLRSGTHPLYGAVVVMAASGAVLPDGGAWGPVLIKEGLRDKHKGKALSVFWDGIPLKFDKSTPKFAGLPAYFDKSTPKFAGLQAYFDKSTPKFSKALDHDDPASFVLSGRPIGVRGNLVAHAGFGELVTALRDAGGAWLKVI
jgi:hypothetical protein